MTNSRPMETQNACHKCFESLNTVIKLFSFQDKKSLKYFISIKRVKKAKRNIKEIYNTIKIIKYNGDSISRPAEFIKCVV